MLNYTKELRKNFSALFERKEIYSSSKLKDFHKLEIELRSKKGQVNAMQTSIRELIQKKEDLSQKIMLLQRQQQKGKSDKTSISLQVATIVERNSSLRRDLGKYKLRIDEFMQNHILAIRNEVPELLKPLLTSISREGTEFSKIQHLLLPLNIPHRLRPEQCLSQPMRSPVTHKQLRRVFEALYVGLHQSEHCLIDQIRLKTVCPDIIEKTVPKSLMLKEDDKEKRDRLRMIDVKTKDEDK